jgi:hypothetical protein
MDMSQIYRLSGISYRFLILRTLLGLVLGSLTPGMLVAAQDEFPNQDQWPAKTEELRNDDLDLLYPQAQAVLVEMPTQDLFGYKYSTVSFDPGIDITGQGPLTFQDPDDDYAGPIDIGFGFKFYENTYSQIYVSTDGLISFEQGVVDTSNQLLPHDIRPNNLIAPLWMDLNTCPTAPCSDKVFTKLLPNPTRFVVQWTDVVRYGSTNKQHFQVILYPSGNIRMQYKTITGDLGNYTIGIEDRDGADGLTYIHNGAPSGITSGSAVQFTRPAPSPRVKITPLYQSGFVIKKQVTTDLYVHNTGDSAPQDTFNLEILPADTEWKITLYGENGTLLRDSNGDGLIDTGPLDSGSSIELSILFEGPEMVKSGDTFQFQLMATSSLEPSVAAVVPIQIAVPAPFAQTMSDNMSGVFLDTIWENSWRRAKVSPSIFTGNTMSVTGLGKGSYIFMWERNGYNTSTNSNYTNIEYVVLTQTGKLAKSLQRLTQTDLVATSTVKVDARYPALATAPNHSTGVLWVENRLNQLTGKKMSNIYFALIDGQGQVVFGPSNISGSTEWLDTNLYRSPVIASTGDGRFTLAWLKSKAGTTELLSAVLDSSGAELIAPRVLFSESGSETDLLDPTLSSMSGNRVFAAATLYEANAQTPVYRIHYGFFDSAGTTLKSFTPINDSLGWKPDAVQVTTGNLILAWTNPFNNTITVTALEDRGYTLTREPYSLPPIGSRLPDYVSVTKDPSGRAVLTWMDFKQYDHLFYALLDGNAGIVTPPMIFASGAAEVPLIQTSFASQGNAPYLGAWDIVLPTLMR